MKNNDKGFTLIELLAVIVILGLLMAIAIPSVTRYITQSRKKTVVTSIDGYISSAVNAVNDQDYKFSTPNTIYAVPIECIAIEKGGDSPFGEWMQANNDYWAYVLVQYDSSDFSYTYGFTFKDSSGYGMYPTVQSEIDPKSSTQIKTGLELSKPTSGSYTNIALKDNWTGFDIDDETMVVVLESTEGTADGINTCVLCQKGNNYDEIKQEKEDSLKTLTIGSSTYQFEEGMTWEEWVNSSYNIDGYILFGNEIRVYNDADDKYYIVDYDCIVTSESIDISSDYSYGYAQSEHPIFDEIKYTISRYAGVGIEDWSGPYSVDHYIKIDENGNYSYVKLS